MPAGRLLGSPPNRHCEFNLRARTGASIFHTRIVRITKLPTGRQIFSGCGPDDFPNRVHRKKSLGISAFRVFRFVWERVFDICRPCIFSKRKTGQVIGRSEMSNLTKKATRTTRVCRVRS